MYRIISSASASELYIFFLQEGETGFTFLIFDDPEAKFSFI
jgi:hypothetical protein